MDVIDRQEIETVFTANLKQLETAIIRYGNAMESAAARQDRAFRQSNANIERSALRMNQSLRAALAVGAIAVAGREVIEYEATWRNLTNTLKLYEGVIGPAEQATFRLNAVAINASVNIGELGNLTGAAARAVGGAKDQFRDTGTAVFEFSELVSKAAQISNNGSAAVSGALTQLSQAIASPRVQLGEFNSIIEGTPRLAQAFADGIGIAKGSIFELRQQIIAGNVSGVDLIQGLITQAAVLREEFGGMTTGAAEALNRFKNRLAEFIGTNQGAIDAQQGLAGAIDFVSENLEALTEAIIIGGAALAGFWGASTLASITAGLGGMTKGLKGTAAAMALLNGVSKVFGGPWVIGITAVAGALAYFALQGDAASESMDRLEKTLSDYRRASGDIQSDTRKLTELQDDLTEAVRNQQGAIEATKRAEIAALRERIAANQDLLKIQGLLAKAELGQVSEQVSRATETSLGDNINILSPEARARSVLSARASAAATDPDQPGLVDMEKRKAEFIRLLDEQIAANDRVLDAGGKLSEQDAAAYKIKADYLNLLAREADLRKQLQDLRPKSPYGTDLRDEVDPLSPPATGGGDKGDSKEAEKLREAFLAARDEINRAYNDTFETEIQAVERIYEARLAGLKKTAASEQEYRDLALKAEQVKDAEIAKINAEKDKQEAERNDQADKRRADQAAEELQLLDDILYARDAAHGRTLDLIKREFAARRAEVEATYTDEIESAARKAEALAALQEEEDKTIADVRQRALDDARDFSETDVVQAEVDRIHDEAQARIDAINAAYGGEIEAHREAQDAITEIIAEANDQIADLSRERLTGYVEDVGSIFGSLAGIIEDYGGKQSGAYKALIAIERAFTFASLTLNIAQGIGQAIKVGFPQNIPLIAGVVAQGATALSMLAPKGGGFQRGGHTGHGADTDVRGLVHANEYVQDAPTVRWYGVDIMRALQFRRIPKEALRGYQRGGYVGTPPPSIQRAADRITRQATAAAATIRQTSNIYNVQQGDVTLYGRDDADVVQQLRGELEQSEGRLLAQLGPAVANDIRRGGGEISSALQDSYSLARRGT
ncbi:tape measure protein [Hyphomonas sp.]|uniref:tape measure protein n=1 Tax=Hyphomonas sp. TaxID=87 RepID=UPI0025BFCA33|nr:tape measure protein [Hyphomonas sp.]MBI1401458.1 tape measure protein [Hyphomonas sp.]